MKIMFALFAATILAFTLPDVLGGGNFLVDSLAKAWYGFGFLAALLLAKFLFTLISYGCGVPAEYEPLLDAALADCPRADSLRQLLRETPRDRRAGMAFLVAYMPQGDRDTMRLDLLRENVEYAYRARAEYPWTRALPALSHISACAVSIYASSRSMGSERFDVFFL